VMKCDARISTRHTLAVLICCAMWLGFVATGLAQNSTDAGGSPTVAPDKAKENLVTFVQPDYPPLAKAARIQGIVHASIVIDETGSVKNLTLISGHPMLAPAALEAIRKWKYKPFQVDGKTTSVQTEVQVSIPGNVSQAEIDLERKFQDTYWANERAGRDALNKGDFATAEAKLQVARAAAEERGDFKWLELADVVSMLAGVKEGQKDYPAAETLLKQSLAIHQKHQRADEAEVAGVEFNLAALYVQSQRLSEAESLLLEAARVWELRITDNPMPEPKASYEWHMAMSYFAAARIAASANRSDEAQSRCRKAIHVAEQKPNDEYMKQVLSGCESILSSH
jgi:TonB family protein